MINHGKHSGYYAWVYTTGDQSLFSSYDGWALIPLKKTSGYNSGFIAERTILGKKESCNVHVLFEKNVPADALNRMYSSEKGPYGQTHISGLALIVPQQADISDVPEDVRIYFMRSFAIRGDALVWLKKPVHRSIEEKMKALESVRNKSIENKA